MPQGSVGLSKSRVMAGLQCPKRLWWTVHEPTAPELEPDETLQAFFDDGHLVGEVARTYVPGGVLIDLVELQGGVPCTKVVPPAPQYGIQPCNQHAHVLYPAVPRVRQLSNAAPKPPHAPR